MTLAGELLGPLIYDLENSSMVILSSNKNDGADHQQHNCDSDAELIRDVMKDTEFISDSLLINSLGDCNKEGLQVAIEKQVSKVTTKDGLFVFTYCGGACDLRDEGLALSVNEIKIDHEEDPWVRIDSDASVYRYSLALKNFKPDDPETHVSGATIGKMITAAYSPSLEKKRILVILDCPFAEEISLDIKRSLSNCELSIIVSQTNKKSPHYLCTLGCSTFSYFFTTVLSMTKSKREMARGMVRFRSLFKKVERCCNALSTLIMVHKDRIIEKNTTVPKGETVEIPPNSEPRIECDEDQDGDLDQIDGGGKFGELLEKYYKRGWLRRARLCTEAVEWVDKVMQGPLVVLKEEEVLEDKVLASVIGSMMFSVATIQNGIKDGSIDNTNIFIQAYIRVIAAVQTVDCNVNAKSFSLFQVASDFYMRVLNAEQVQMREMAELIKTIKMDKPNCFSYD